MWQLPWHCCNGTWDSQAGLNEGVGTAACSCGPLQACSGVTRIMTGPTRSDAAQVEMHPVSLTQPVRPVPSLAMCRSMAWQHSLSKLQASDRLCCAADCGVACCFDRPPSQTHIV